MKKITKVNEMIGKKITKRDLEDWMTDNGEDVICDGPFQQCITGEQEELFLNKINSNKKLLKLLAKEGAIDKGDEITWDQCSVGSTDDSCEIILDMFVEFLEEIGITEIPKY